MTATILIEGGTVIDGIGDTPDPTRRADQRRHDHRRRCPRRCPRARQIGYRTYCRAAGKTVMPGMIDAHTPVVRRTHRQRRVVLPSHRGIQRHAVGPQRAQGPARGVTSVLDADCLWNIGVELRDAIEANVVEGPRMAAGGNALMTMLGGTAGQLIADEGRTGYATVVHNLEGSPRRCAVRSGVRRRLDQVMVTGLIPSVKGPEVKVEQDRDADGRRRGA